MKKKGREWPPRRITQRPPFLAEGPQRRCLGETYKRSPGTGRIHNLGKECRGERKDYSFEDTKLYANCVFKPSQSQ